MLEITGYDQRLYFNYKHHRIPFITYSAYLFTNSSLLSPVTVYYCVHTEKKRIIIYLFTTLLINKHCLAVQMSTFAQYKNEERSTI